MFPSGHFQPIVDISDSWLAWVADVKGCCVCLSAWLSVGEGPAVDRGIECFQVREEDLSVLVGEAASFMQKERARASKRARRHKDGRVRSISLTNQLIV